MGKSVTALIVMGVFLLSWVATSHAGSRYHHGRSWRNIHYDRSPVYYRHDYRNHHSHGNRYWSYLGVGLLAGTVIGAIAYSSYTPQTVVYTRPAPVFVYREPVVVYQPYRSPFAGQPETVLRKVETTPRLLNVRSRPGLDGIITDRVQQGEQLDVIGAAPGWLYIKTLSGQYGWVMTQYTREADGPVG